MELNGALSNPLVTDKKLSELSELYHRLLVRKRQPVPKVVKDRNGLVLETVKHVLALAGKPMQAKDIHEACEQLLDRPVSYSTVKDCLSEPHRKKSLFNRVGYGQYELA